MDNLSDLNANLDEKLKKRKILKIKSVVIKKEKKYFLMTNQKMKAKIQTRSLLIQMMMEKTFLLLTSK
jgi:hypothetical protein